MAKKNRYCPNCGAKTDDYVCDICDRKTKPISEKSKEEMLDIVEDEDTSIEKREQSDFVGDQGHKESKEYHKENKRPILKMDKGNHPYYEAHSKKNTEMDIATLFRGIAIAIVVIILIGIVFSNLVFSKPEPEQPTTNLEGMGDYEETELMMINIEKVKNLVIFEDNPKVKVTPVLGARDEDNVMILKNPSLYYVKGYLLNNGESSETYILEPRSSIEVENIKDFDNKTTFTIESTFHVMDAPTTPYTYEEKIVDGNRISTLYIEKDITKNELKKLGEYVMAGKLYQNELNENVEAINVVHKEGKTLTSLYTITLYYEIDNITIEQVNGKAGNFETSLFKDESET